VFCYNVQPGVEIDYRDGTNQLAEGDVRSMPGAADEERGGEERADSAADEVHGGTADSAKSGTADSEIHDYVLNTNSKKFHEPSCGSAKKISAKNRQDYHGSREALIQDGYEPCKNCDP
jgi:DNA-entry nuclease